MNKSFYFVLLILFGFCLVIGHSCAERSEIISPLTESWEKAIPFQKLPEGLISLSAKDCGRCHQDHFNEWKKSTHSFAWVDKQFQAEIKKESSPFLCLNCHIPLENQQKFLVHGLINSNIHTPKVSENQQFDQSLQLEGITCAVCHVRDQHIIGPSGTKNAPHKTKKDTVFLSESLCISCHNASAIITKELVCSFETGDEWEVYSRANGETCIDCHMVKTNREIVKGYLPRESRFHTFSGSGIPKASNHEAIALNGLSIQLNTTSDSLQISRSYKANLILRNDYAGHKVPTGDPERFIEIICELQDSVQKTISSIRDTIGEKWNWYPKAEKLYENNLRPLQEHVTEFDYVFKNPGIYTLTFTVLKHRLDVKSAHYNKLDDSYPLFIEIYNVSKNIVVR